MNGERVACRCRRVGSIAALGLPGSPHRRASKSHPLGVRIPTPLGPLLRVRHAGSAVRRTHRRPPVGRPTSSPDRPRSPRSPRRALAAPQSAGGAGVPVLVVTAAGREAESVTAALGDLLGADHVELFPSWETLPHERLSPRPDTVGQRLSVLRRLAHPEEHSAGLPSVVVTTVRSMIQPIAPDLGELSPVRLRVGDEYDLAGADRAAGAALLQPCRPGHPPRRARRPWRHPRPVPADRRAPLPDRVLRRRGRRDPHLRGHRPAVDRLRRRGRPLRRAGRSC